MKKAPQAVVVKNFEPSEILSRHRARLAAVEQNRPDQGLIDATFGFERNLFSGPQWGFQVGKGSAHETDPTADFIFSLTCCRAGRAQVLEGLDYFQEYATTVRL